MGKILMDVWGEVISSPQKNEIGMYVKLHKFDEENYYLMKKIGEHIFDEWSHHKEGIIDAFLEKNWEINWEER